MVMKLAAVYCVWGDQELLAHSVKKIRPLVDGIIICYSTVSNFGELDAHTDFLHEVDYIVCNPSGNARESETRKRQAGLDRAREKGFTHFLMMDADEFYEDFTEEKKRFDNPDLLGLVCRTKVYFKSPDLTIGFDTTIVPFIHKITPGLRFAFNQNYPFAWTDEDGKPFTVKKRIRIDPTRSMNINSGVQWSEVVMHHYSWVRSDIKKKIRNSTARQNIEGSSITRDYASAKPGYFCHFYGKQLESCRNLFGVPDLIDVNIKL